MTFERFDAHAQLIVLLAQDECRLLGHGGIGADHLLIAVARVDNAILGLTPQRVRDIVTERRGARRQSESRDALPFSTEAMAAIKTADDEATARGHTHVRPGHILLALLAAGDTTSQILRAAGVSEAAARASAEQAAARPVSGDAPARATRGGVERVQALEEGRFEDAIRAGHPVMVRLHHAPPLGDIGNVLVDARLLKLVLAADGRAGRMLRSHSVDEVAVDGLLKPTA